MSSREDYRKYPIEDFESELTESLKVFIRNMNKLGINNISFPEWYETFGAWLEVGTSMEEESYK